MSSGQNSPSALLLFTSTQAPLPVRYPHPHKPRFVIPPLVHRTLHDALDSKSNGEANGPSPGFLLDRDRLIIPHPESIVKHDQPSSSDTPPLPSELVNHANTNIVNDRLTVEGDLELTLKLTLVGSGSAEERCKWVDEALDVLSTYKGLGAISIDTLLIGWKGVDYKGKKTAVSEFFGCGAEGLEGGGGSEEVSIEIEDDVERVWGMISSSIKKSGRVKRLGTMYLPLGVLKRLVGTSDGGVEKPEINMLDTPDCHHLPKEYSGFAKESDVELWAGGGGEGANPLPDAELHNVLQEFAEPLSLPSPINTLIPLRADQLKYELESPESVQPGVHPKWVLGYTVLSKARNVVKDRGYIISATL